jgi:hypothetical protein
MSRPRTTPELPRIRAKQEIAITALLSGATDGEAAKLARVSRETICRWRHGDPNFVAEMSRRRQELWNGGTDALRSLLPRAGKVVGEALDAPSPTTRLRAASLLFRTVGMGDDRLKPSGAPTTAADVEEAWVRMEEEARQGDANARSITNLLTTLAPTGTGN